MKIGVIGLGKLGLCLASVLGNSFKTIGIDVNSKNISNLRKGLCHINEKSLPEWLKSSHMIPSDEFSTLKGCKVIFCIVPTPSLPSGGFSNKYIKSAINSAKPYLKKCKLFVIVSTVMPGSCKKLKKLLPDTKLCYNPEFIVLGDVINGIINPDFILIGEEDKQSGDLLERVYRKVTNAPFKRMDWKSAEIAKIGLNAYVTMKISFANILGEICDREKADVDKITKAIGTDVRIGNKFFKSAVAYGGPCFPRDNRAFAQMAGDIPNYSKLTDNINNHQIERIYKKIEKQVGIKSKNISIIGLAYKNDTNIIEESAGVKIAAMLKNKGANVSIDIITPVTDLVVFMLPKSDIYSSYVRFCKNWKIKYLDTWRDK